MFELIEADTRLDAWMHATERLLLTERRAKLNLTLVVHQPGKSSQYATTHQCVDRFMREEEQPSIHSVAETIFPAYEYRKFGIEGVFETYPDLIYPLIKRHPKITWGTYAYRLVRREAKDQTVINPLRQMLAKMKSELASMAPKRSCYELGVSHSDFELPLYSPGSDGTRRMGGPCLSHLSFKLYSGAVHLVAVYRSHDYRHKVPGNLLGLARLQACVASETGLRLGTLVVHSTYAFLNGTKGPLRSLLAEIRGSTSQGAAG